MDLKLELVAIPVTDVDRAKAFYAEQVGFIVEHDHTVERADPLRAADAAGLGVLDRARGRDRRLRARLERAACSSPSPTRTLHGPSSRAVGWR